MSKSADVDNGRRSIKFLLVSFESQAENEIGFPKKESDPNGSFSFFLVVVVKRVLLLLGHG